MLQKFIPQKIQQYFLNKRLTVGNFKELQIAIESALKNRVIANDTFTIVKGAISFEGKKARDIMVPLSKIHWLPMSYDKEYYLDKIANTNHSRFPIFNVNNEVIGIVLAKEFLVRNLTKDFDIRAILRKAYIIPESQSIISLLQEFRQQRYHMALVIDEFGAISGLVTIEDVLEEIVGEIYDETDKLRQLVIKKSDVLFEVQAEIEIEQFNEHFETSLSSEYQETLAGLVIEVNGSVPKVGNTITVEDNIQIRILKGSERKIETLEVKLLQKND